MNNFFIGLDVHKATVSIAVAEDGREGEVRSWGTIQNTPAQISRLLKRLAISDRNLHFCHEAGPCGYGLYRQIIAAGHKCTVAAPSAIPSRPGERVKTDRLDAMKLARLLRAGELTPVWVPDTAHEAMRDLIRSRVDAMEHLRSAKRQLLAFLLRQGRIYAGRKHWTRIHFEWLATQEFIHPAHQIVFQDYVNAVLDNTQRHKQLVGMIEKMLPGWSMKPLHAALCTMTRARLAEIGERLRASAQAVAEARSAASTAGDELIRAQQLQEELTNRKNRLDAALASVAETYAAAGLSARAEDPAQAESLLLQERQVLVRLERALLILESSGAVDRVRSLESRVASQRASVEEEIVQLTAAEKALEAARHIDGSARTVANEILAEQFDTVMPLLKELYRRLRPHSEWKDIEVEFGGRVRASLNFSVEGGRNPAFLFSSGQRRAAGLAFLLAIHLSRQWCRWQSLLLDDPVQHIDDYRALNLVEVLAAIRRTGRQVIVAVEDPALADVLCRRLRASLDDFGRRFDLHTSKTGSAEIAETRDIHTLPRAVFGFAQAS